MKLSIKKFADLTGVSVRTLHYYDEIGLLKPDLIDAENGYRFYGDNALLRMQEILFYRELDFPLKTIREIISSPNYDKQEALKGQHQLLLLKLDRLKKIISLIERAERGEVIMGFNIFDNSDFEAAQKNYKEEAELRWGKTAAYRENQMKTAGYSKEKWDDIGKGLNCILKEFADAMKNGSKENDDAAAVLVQKLQNYITETQYTCTDEILLSLGEMYVSDERFKRNIDQYGIGAAEYINGAIKACCGKR